MATEPMVGIEDRSIGEFADWLARVTARGHALLAVYRTDPERFRGYRDAVDRADVRLNVAERDSLAMSSRLADHRRTVAAACHAGVLTPEEARKVLTRHEFELSMPLIEDAQHAWDVAWAAFWHTLRVAEREALQARPPAS